MEETEEEKTEIEKGRLGEKGKGKGREDERQTVKAELISMIYDPDRQSCLPWS